MTSLAYLALKKDCKTTSKHIQVVKNMDLHLTSKEKQCHLKIKTWNGTPGLLT
jgi:hypothetical protein